MVLATWGFHFHFWLQGCVCVCGGGVASFHNRPRYGTDDIFLIFKLIWTATVSVVHLQSLASEVGATSNIMTLYHRPRYKTDDIVFLFTATWTATASVVPLPSRLQ